MSDEALHGLEIKNASYLNEFSFTQNQFTLSVRTGRASCAGSQSVGIGRLFGHSGSLLIVPTQKYGLPVSPLKTFAHPSIPSRTCCFAFRLSFSRCIFNCPLVSFGASSGSMGINISSTPLRSAVR